MSCKPCIYFAEGQCEKKLIDALRIQDLIPQGRVEVFNVLIQRITRSKLMTIKPGTTVVMVFDTDVDYDLTTFRKNCDLLKKYVQGVQIKYLIQVKNLEDELVRSTNIKTIEELTKSKSNSDFKTDFIKLSDCYSTLASHNFDIHKIWKQKPSGAFEKLEQWRL